MRLILILILFAPALCALDMKDVDRDTCRFVRLALLQDDVRAHFGLRIGDFESLDQALRVDVKMTDAKHLLLLCLKTKAAAVFIQTDGKMDRAGTFCFFEVEQTISASAVLDGLYVTVACKTNEDETPVRTRLLRCLDGKPQVCLSWLSETRLALQNDRYLINTTRAITRNDGGLLLQERTEYLLDNERVEGGLESSTTTLVDNADGFTLGHVEETPVAVATHCAIARRLERHGLNEAALHHARAAKLRATLDKLGEADTRRLEAQTLAARLEARLRTVEITRK